MAAIQRLRKEDWRLTPILYREYVHIYDLDSSLTHGSYAWARDWNGLVRAFRSSFTDSVMDELILLLYSKSPRPYGWRSTFARPVIYDKLEDITSGIAFQAPRQVDGPLGVSRLSQPSTVIDSHPVGDDHDGDQEQEDTPHENTAEDDLEEYLVVQEGPEAQTPEFQAKIHAAKKIQATCIRYLERKKAIPTGIHAIRMRFWSQLRTRAAGMAWGHTSRYKLTLQGPVVHVLVCLDVIGAATNSAKREVKKRSKVAHHEELEELMESQARYRSELFNNLL